MHCELSLKPYNKIRLNTQSDVGRIEEVRFASLTEVL